MEQKSNKKQAVLYRMILDGHECPFGSQSLKLLKDKGYDIDEKILATRKEVDEFKNKHHVKTTPQTFIDGKRIGGHDDLCAFFEQRQQQ